MKRRRSLNNSNPLFLLLCSPRSLSYSTLTLVQGPEYTIFFSSLKENREWSACEFWPQRPRPAPTSSMRMIKVALCPCSATRRPSVVTTWRPRGAFPGHIWALAVYFSLSPSVQLLDTIRRYLKSVDNCQWCGCVVCACYKDSARDQEQDRYFAQLLLKTESQRRQPFRELNKCWGTAILHLRKSSSLNIIIDPTWWATDRISV